MGPNRRAAAEAAAKANRAEAERKAIAEAQKIVAIWNARQAGGRALPGYGQDASVDLSTLDRHNGGAISGLIPLLSAADARLTRRAPARNADA